MCPHHFFYATSFFHFFFLFCVVTKFLNLPTSRYHTAIYLRDTWTSLQFVVVYHFPSSLFNFWPFPRFSCCLVYRHRVVWTSACNLPPWKMSEKSTKDNTCLFLRIIFTLIPPFLTPGHEFFWTFFSVVLYKYLKVIAFSTFLRFCV